jgi:hypothetical protein
MSPTCVAGSAGTRYRYYACSNAQRRGWQQCPSKSLSGNTIERLVITQVRALANDPDRLREMAAEIPRDLAVEQPGTRWTTTTAPLSPLTGTGLVSSQGHLDGGLEGRHRVTVANSSLHGGRTGTPFM